MTQNKETGAAGRDYGLRMGRVLATLMGAEKLSEHSNEVIWNGRRAALKACAPRNDTFGVTAAMLARLDDIMAGFENEKGDVEVWRMSAEDFRSSMRPSPSAAARGTDTRLGRKSQMMSLGQRVATFSKAAVAAVPGQ